MNNAIRFVFIGEIDCDSFVEFAWHRAGRLDLRMAVGFCDRQSIAVTVAGQQALVDMFEMACSLGPYNCIVHDVTRTEADLPGAGP